MPPELQGQKALAIAACYAGELDAGMKAVQPIKDLAPAVDMVGPIPYVVLQTLIDEPNAPGRRYYGKSEYLEELSDEIIDILVASAETVPSPFTQLTFQHYGGGAISALPADATAFNHRDAKFVFSSSHPGLRLRRMP